MGGPVAVRCSRLDSGAPVERLDTMERVDSVRNDLTTLFVGRVAAQSESFDACPLVRDSSVRFYDMPLLKHYVRLPDRSTTDYQRPPMLSTAMI